MEISGIISAIVVGIVIGLLGRLVLPGQQRIGLLWTVLVGIVAALAERPSHRSSMYGDTEGLDWIELLIQVALAAAGGSAVQRVRGKWLGNGPQWTASSWS